MAYKDLLVVVDSSAAAPERLRIAAELAERFDAHLAGLYVARASRPEQPEAQDQARSLFEGIVGPRRISVGWRVMSGFPADAVATEARCADLVIIGQLDPGDPLAPVDHPRPEEIALSIGRPVLIVPYVGKYPTLGQRVVIAWDGSREATRAVNDALPFLAAASSITVLMVDPAGNYEKGEEHGAAIAAHLGRHGIYARIVTTVSDGMGVGDILLSRASDLCADLLIMGAYAHSRVRELVTGGATRTILKSMTLPVLMAH